MMQRRWKHIRAGLFVLISLLPAVQAHSDVTAISNAARQAVSRLDLEMSAYWADDKSYALNAVRNVVNRSAHDYSGAKAAFDITRGDDYEFRKEFYKKNILKLVAMEDFATTINYEEMTSDFMTAVTPLALIGEDERALGLEELAVGMSFYDANEYMRRVFRRDYLRWSKYARLDYVGKHVAKWSEAMGTINNIAVVAGKVVKIRDIDLATILMKGIDSGLRRQRLDSIKSNSALISDAAFQEALEEADHLIVCEEESYISRLVQNFNIAKTTGEFPEYFNEVLTSTGEVAVGALVLALLKKAPLNAAKRHIVTYLVVQAAAEVKEDFLDAPKLIVDHFILSTMLLQGYGINPVDADQVAAAFANDVFVDVDNYTDAQLRAYLLYMFYVNLRDIMRSSNMFLDSWIKWFNPVHYLEVISCQCNGEFIRRDLVESEAITLAGLAKEYNEEVSLVSVSMRLDYRPVQCVDLPWNAVGEVLAFRLTVGGFEPDYVEWNFYRMNSADGVGRLIEGATQGYGDDYEKTFSDPGKYRLSVTVTAPDGVIFGDVLDFEIKAADVTVSKLGIYPADRKIVRRQGALIDLVNIFYAYVEYSDGTSEFPSVYCGDVHWTINPPGRVNVVADLGGAILVSPGELGAVTVSVDYLGYNMSSTAEVALSYLDVDSSAWYAKYVCSLFESGVVEGYSDGTFRPGSAMNRAEFVQMLVRASGKFCLFGCSVNLPYGDVTEDDWFYDAVAIAYKEGWLAGGASFRPADEINRAEATKLVIAAVGLSEAAFSAKNPAGDYWFSDVQDPGDWFYRDVYIARGSGILDGYMKDSIARFGPSKSINRAEVAKLLTEAFWDRLTVDDCMNR